MFEFPKEDCSKIGESMKDLFNEMKSSNIAINPIDFIFNYRSNYPDENDGGDSIDCLQKLFEILNSNFEVNQTIYMFQIKQNATCCNGHVFQRINEIELCLELHLYNNQYKTIEDYIKNLFTEIKCPIEDKLVLCQYHNYIEPLPLIIFIHPNRYYYSADSQEAERLPFNINVSMHFDIGNTHYHFKAAILQYGGRNNGHYKAHICKNEKSYLYDDSLVEELHDTNLNFYNEK
ncbi:hypothetical protein M9Y10_044617 [Tritrichomonas musculus]|uniref:USP domain-containing protein n=1 Tax=Tritrichomonas musculus TaxID=1915356 RepID=A0ABR2JT54_9EUKA